MKVRFTASAQAELREAYHYYESQRPGLGQDFARKVGAAVNKIRQHPELWPVMPRTGQARRYRTKKFPYAVVYKVKADHIRVLAIMHLRRRPGYWMGRDDEENGVT